MTVFVKLKVSRICHYNHYITFSTAVTSTHTCNRTDCIFYFKKKTILCTWSHVSW